MAENFSIHMADEEIGKVQVHRQGLYYRFICRCRLTGAVIYRLVVECGGKESSLGVLVPEGGSFGLDTKLPVKSVGEGQMLFRVVPKHPEGKFIPIYPEEPFRYLEKLRNAYLEYRDGQAGVVIQE